MFTVICPSGLTFNAEFHHKQGAMDGRKRMSGGLPYTPPKRITVARAFSQDGQCIANGLSSCASSDNFCRATGRKIAYGRLLKELGLSKSDRFAAWQEYFMRFGLKGKAAR